MGLLAFPVRLLTRLRSVMHLNFEGATEIQGRADTASQDLNVELAVYRLWVYCRVLPV